ncbi:CCSMST1 family [Trinorchestia longiramus]|nr:CCSMST1 family [Trinorchestia longiramus]
MNTHLPFYELCQQLWNYKARNGLAALQAYAVLRITLKTSVPSLQINSVLRKVFRFHWRVINQLSTPVTKMIFTSNSVLMSSICRNAASSATRVNLTSRSLAATRMCIRRASSKKQSDQPMSEPVKFSESPAFKFKPQLSYSAENMSDRPWFEPYVVMSSVAIFMIYFFILREENDIDGRLGSKSIEAQVRDYEIQVLEASFEKCRRAGADTSEIEERLFTLLEEKENASV